MGFSRQECWSGLPFTSPGNLPDPGPPALQADSLPLSCQGRVRKVGKLSKIYQFISFTQLCPTLCNPMDCSTPGLPVHHQLPEFIQTHVPWVGDAIHSSHPLSSPSLPAFHLSFPASGSFQMSQPFASGGQSIGVSASASVLPMNIQGWFPLGRTGWISLQSKGLSRVFFTTTVQKHQFFGTQSSVMVQLSHPYMTTGKTTTLTRWTFVGKVMSLLFNMLSRFVVNFQGTSVF